MKILVISSCAKSQKHNKLPNRLTLTDFRSPDRLARRMEELNKYKEPSAEMYAGRNHKLLMEGLTEVRGHSQYGKVTIDLYIISTGYGLISEHDLIAPYDVKLKDAEWKRIPDFVSKKALEVINDYDLVFFLLGKDVEALRLRQCSFPQDMANWVFILAPTYFNKLPCNLKSNRVVEAGKNLACELSRTRVNLYNLRGFIFEKLCAAVCREGFHVFEQVKEDPQQLLEIVLEQ